MSSASSALRTDPHSRAPQPQRREIVRLLRRKRRLRAGGLTLLTTVFAIGLGIAVPQLPLGGKIPTSRAIEMLIAVAAGTVTFIGIVFSLLFLVVQFASTAFTPRLNLFHDAPIVWRAFAFYVGVVSYSFTAALMIGRDEHTSGVVPLIAVLGVLASIVLYRQLQTTAFRSVHLDSTLDEIARRGRQVLDDLYTVDVATAVASPRAERAPSASAAHGGGQEVRWPHPGAVIQVIDVPRVLRAAERAECVIELRVRAGQTISEGTAVAGVSTQVGAVLTREILKAITPGIGRTFEQDPTLALRLLADIALKGLSPAVNDPTTAVQALDGMDGLLRRLATRDLEIGNITDSTGATRVTLALPTWDDYLAVSLDELLALPDPSPNVSCRLTQLLDDLSGIAPPAREPALQARRDARSLST